MRESLQQQTATADVLKVISRSTFDLQTVLDTLVESAARLCEADMGAIVRPQGSRFQFAANYQLPPEFVELATTTAIASGRGTLAGRVLLEGHAVHIPDVLADQEYTFWKGAKEIQIRSGLGVPLLREGTPIGVIILWRKQVRPFTDKQIELVETFADQAVIAIENVRLFDQVQARTRELCEALEQQTATSEVLQVISSSPGELELVFQAMLVNAVRICEANLGVMFRVEGSSFQAVAWHGASPAFADWWKDHSNIQPAPGSVLGRLATTRQTVHVPDLAAEPAYLDGNPVAVAGVELGGIRTLVVVPMLKDNALIGAVTIYRRTVRLFTDKQVELLASFADQAVIAIENTRLLRELRESLQQQTATSEVLQVISSSPGELEPVFQAMLENATRICEAKFGNFLLYDGNELRVVAMHGAPVGWAELRGRDPAVRPWPNNPLGRIVKTKQLQHIADIRTEKAYLDRDPAFVPLGEVAGARTLLIVPMLKENELVGVLGIYRQEVRPFTDKQIELVQNFAESGRHRYRECPTAQRAARILAAADRHRRRAQGDQPVDVRSQERPQHAGRVRRTPVRGRYGGVGPTKGFDLSL